MLVPTLLIFLVPYSVVATVAAVMLYLKVRSTFYMPDLLPDPDPSKKGGTPQRFKHDLPIAPKNRVSLRQPIRVGDLEVVPEKVERTAEDSLVLSLRLRNRSEDWEFAPMSAKFLERPRGLVAAPPYTFLQVGDERLYGGEVRWLPTKTADPDRRASADGRLPPGGEVIARLATDPRDAVKLKALAKAAGPLLWRVHVRRGPALVNLQEVSATSVIGVEFTAKDIQQQEDPDQLENAG
jgi:hypothetical protein